MAPGSFQKKTPAAAGETRDGLWVMRFVPYFPKRAFASFWQRSFASPDSESQRSRAALYSAWAVSCLASLRASATLSLVSLDAAAASLLTLA